MPALSPFSVKLPYFDSNFKTLRKNATPLQMFPCDVRANSCFWKLINIIIITIFIIIFTSIILIVITVFTINIISIFILITLNISRSYSYAVVQQHHYLNKYLHHLEIYTTKLFNNKLNRMLNILYKEIS